MTEIEPLHVVDAIEQYVDRELRDVRTYENRELLDPAGISGLHQLGTKLYEDGFADGTAATLRRKSYADIREQQTRDRARKAEAATLLTNGVGRVSARAALTLIAGEQCSTFTSGDCAGDGRTPDAEYGADRWCDACIARAGLAALDAEEADRG